MDPLAKEDMLRKELRNAERALGDKPSEKNFQRLRDAQNRLNNLRITEKVDSLRSQALAVGELEAELRLAEYVLSRYVNKHVIQRIRDIHQRLREQGAIYPVSRVQPEK
jgi:hypothetical protein